MSTINRGLTLNHLSTIEITHTQCLLSELACSIRLPPLNLTLIDMFT